MFLIICAVSIWDFEGVTQKLGALDTNPYGYFFCLSFQVMVASEISAPKGAIWFTQVTCPATPLELSISKWRALGCSSWPRVSAVASHIVDTGPFYHLLSITGAEKPAKIRCQKCQKLNLEHPLLMSQNLGLPKLQTENPWPNFPKISGPLAPARCCAWWHSLRWQGRWCGPAAPPSWGICPSSDKTKSDAPWPTRGRTIWLEKEVFQITICLWLTVRHGIDGP